MDCELRIYKLRAGSLADFVSAWRREVLPLREREGFRVLGVWCDPEAPEFVWQLSYAGDGDVREAERLYAETRASVVFEDDPAAYVESAQVRFLSDVDLQQQTA